MKINRFLFLAILLLNIYFVKANTYFLQNHFPYSLQLRSQSVTPGKENICKRDLLKILDEIPLTLAKDRDSINWIVQQLQQFEKSACSEASQSFARLYIAQLLWNKYQRNSYRIDQRTAVEAIAPMDMNEWTSNQYYLEIRNNLMFIINSLNHFNSIRASNYSSFIDHLQKDSKLSLYDFFAEECLRILTQMNYRFENDNSFLTATVENNLFESSSVFINTDFSIIKSTTVKDILQLYQSVLRNSTKNDNWSFFVKMDMKRLDFSQNLFPSDENGYKNGLEKLYNRFIDTDEEVRVASAFFPIVLRQTEQDSLKNLYHIRKRILLKTNQLIQKYAQQVNVCDLKRIKASLEEGRVNVSLKQQQYANQLIEATLSFQNIKNAHLEVLNNEGKIVWEKEFFLSDSLNLVSDQKVIEIEGLPFGIYSLQMKTTPVIPLTKEMKQEQVKKIQKESFVVSNLFATTRRTLEDKTEVYVVDAITGKPVRSAIITFYEQQNRRKKSRETFKVLTNELGLATVDVPLKTAGYITIQSDKDFAYPKIYLSNYWNTVPFSTKTITRFFTDRSLYRPGQTLFYKGIVYDQNINKSVAKINYPVDINFYDFNHQVIVTKKVTTDSFGAFSGEIEIPQNSMNGFYQITTHSGSIQYKVENYKRPSFIMSLNAPKGSYTFNEMISLEGNFESFLKKPAVAAKITYVINFKKSVWGKSTRIDTGTIYTNDKGIFDLKFMAQEPNEYKNLKTDYKNGLYQIVINGYAPNGEILTENLDIPINANPFSINADFKQKNEAFSTEKDLKFFNKAKPLSLKVRIKNTFGQEIVADIQTKLIYNSISSDSKDTLKQLVQVDTIPQNVEFEYHLNNQKEGLYTLLIEAKDKRKHLKTKNIDFVLFSESSKKLPYSITELLYIPVDSCEWGTDLFTSIGTTVKDAYILVQLETEKGQTFSQIKKISNELRSFKIPFKSSYGNSFQLSCSFVKDGILHSLKSVIHKKVETKGLNIQKRVFRDYVKPNIQEKWSFVIKDRHNHPVEAQILASLYDKSLDQLMAATSWHFNPLYQKYTTYNSWNKNQKTNIYVSDYWSNYSHCEEDSIISLKQFDYQYSNNQIFLEEALPKTTRQMVMLNKTDNSENKVMGYGSMNQNEEENEMNEIIKEGPENTITDDPFLRKDFNETSFFYPSLTTDSLGIVNVSFTTPEKLSSWQYRMMANTRDMQMGWLDETVITSKDFYVSINAPTFVRQSDKLVFPCILTNSSDTIQTGKMKYELFNPYNNQIIEMNEKGFSIKKNGSEVFYFTIEPKPSLDLIGIKVTAECLNYADGEQYILPVLPSKTLVLESLSLPMNGKEKKNYIFQNYMNSSSKSSQNYRYTIEYTSNPIYYALQALPVLSNNNGVSVSNAISLLYANVFSQFLLDSIPQIQTTISSWNRSKSLNNSLFSSLQKNENLKQLLLNQTPWVLQAQNETQNIQLLKNLFDRNFQERNKEVALRQLKQLQNEDGGFSWYPQMNSSLFQTLLVLEYNTKLKNLESITFIDQQMIKKAIYYVDREVEKLYDFQNRTKETMNFENFIAWLYIRSYYKNYALPTKLGLLKQSLLKINGKLLQKYNLSQLPMLSIASRNYGLNKESDTINRYLLSISSADNKNGLYWKNNRAYFNGVSPLRVHVLMMEALQKGNLTEKQVESMKLWLLKQKQIQMWNNNLNTLDAIYALVTYGVNWMLDDNNSYVKVANYKYETTGLLGSVDTSFTSNDMYPNLGKIEIQQSANHPGYGAAYWQYFEDFSDVKTRGNGFSLQKQLWKEVQNEQETILEQIKDTINQGDIIVTRFIVKADKDYDFVSLIDQRASGFEVFDQQSSYKWGQGVGYFYEPKDASTNFFFERMPKGTYVFEYKLKAIYSGHFQDGISTIQSFYAPQFVEQTQGRSRVIR